MDRDLADEGGAQWISDASGSDRRAAETAVQLPGGHSGHDLHAAAFYDLVGVFQCGEAGLVAGGGRQGSGGQCGAGFFHRDAQDDPAGSFIGDDLDVHPFDGSVFHSGHPGGE